jgi:hypothetical protein
MVAFNSGKKSASAVPLRLEKLSSAPGSLLPYPSLPCLMWFVKVGLDTKGHIFRTQTTSHGLKIIDSSDAVTSGKRFGFSSLVTAFLSIGHCPTG